MSSLLNPFFAKTPPDNTNFSQFIKMAGSVLNDEEAIAWAETIDWEEPVSSLRRFEDGRRVFVDIQSSSPLEVLIASGDERLVKLIFTSERVQKLAETKWQSPVARTGYDGGPSEILYINAAIKTGSVSLIEYVCDVALKNTKHSIFQWTSSEMRTPLVCLADQRGFSPEKIEEIWGVIEEKGVTYGSGFHSLSQEYADELKKNLRVNFLNTSARIGALNAALVAAKKLKQKISYAHWDELLYGGNIQWAIDEASKDAPWKKMMKPEKAAVIIAERITMQREEIIETFANHTKKKDHLRVNDQNFEHLISSLEDPSAAAPIFVSREDLSECIGAHLVKWKPSRAADFLSTKTASMSVGEAEEWMEKIKKSPKNAYFLSRRLVGCTPGQSAQWAKCIAEKGWVESDKEEIHGALLKLSSALGIDDLHQFLRSHRNLDMSENLFEKIADIQAKHLDRSVSRVSASRSMRRI